MRHTQPLIPISPITSLYKLLEKRTAFAEHIEIILVLIAWPNIEVVMDLDCPEASEYQTRSAFQFNHLSGANAI